MTVPEAPVSPMRRAFDALFPYAVVPPLCGLAALATSAVVAALGTGGLVASFAATLQRLAHAGPAGHGYGILAVVVVWAALVATGVAALALFVVVATVSATGFGVILSGLVDLARLPRAADRTDRRWPRRVAAWTAALSASLTLTLALAARAHLGHIDGAHVFFANLAGASATLAALVVGHALAWYARR